MTWSAPVQRAPVVCTTLTGVLMRDMRDLRFDVAVVDEAAQVMSSAVCTHIFWYLEMLYRYHGRLGPSWPVHVSRLSRFFAYPQCACT